MGAQFQVITRPAMSELELRRNFKDYIQDLDTEYGHQQGYSGQMNNCSGLTISTSVFKKVSEAEDWLSEHTDKRGDAIAVKVGVFKPLFPVTAKDKSLMVSYQETKLAIENFEIMVAKRAKTQKSTKKTCAHCGSSISLRHLSVPDKWSDSDVSSDCAPAIKFMGKYYLTTVRKVTDCPVCQHNLLLTDTDTKNKLTLEKRIKELEAKVQDAKMAYASKMKTQAQGCWVIGACCAS